MDIVRNRPLADPERTHSARCPHSSRRQFPFQFQFPFPVCSSRFQAELNLLDVVATELGWRWPTGLDWLNATALATGDWRLANGKWQLAAATG